MTPTLSSKRGRSVETARQVQYFELREREERRAALAVPSGKLREILNAVADRYADRIWSLIEAELEEIDQWASPEIRHLIEFEPDRAAENSHAI
jgi:hypothetical protein